MIEIYLAILDILLNKDANLDLFINIGMTVAPPIKPWFANYQ